VSGDSLALRAFLLRRTRLEEAQLAEADARRAETGERLLDT
jgi:hypothetical protein